MKAITKLVGISLALALAVGFSLAAAGDALADAGQEIMLGNQAAQAGKLEAAVAHFSKAINTPGISKANLAVAYNNRGSAWDDQKQPMKALADYNQAIQLDPKYHEAYYNRSYALESQDQLKEALADAKKALSLAPGDQTYQERVKELEDKLGGSR
ncbi:MAG: tetratricopeptide repeat protein [Thermodesulfobacteriota bacterium]